LAAPAVSADGASVKVDNGIVKFYFASGKADIAAGGKEALGAVLSGVMQTGKKAAISGFTDPSGDPAKNAELAKQRALAVRDLLKASGIPEDKIVMVRPNDIKEGATTAAEGRRVEVSLL
jgi:K(+)-stimulated pyrophosphate-energized sodium pump